MSFFSSYTPPGVYISQVPNPAAAGLPNGFRLPGLIGVGASYLPVANTSVIHTGSNSSDLIPLSGYASVVSITSIGDQPGSVQYRPGIDFNQSGNYVQWLAGGTQPLTNATYYVTWNRPKVYPTDYAPNMFTNMNDIRNAYGAELNNGVITPVTIAANLLFANGAPAVVISQPLSGLDTDVENAIDTMKTQDVNLLVCPHISDSTLDQYMRNHIITQSSIPYNHERFFITSGDGMSDTTSTLVSKAAGYSHQRWWMVAPPAFTSVFADSVTKQNQTLLLPSSYLACAYAGAICNPMNSPSTSMTRQSLVGVNNLSTFNYLPTDMNYLAANGITVVTTSQNGGGTTIIRHALTTDLTSINTYTASILLITDYIFKTLRPLLDQTYIGTKILASTAAQMTATITTYCNQLIQNQVIVSVGAINVHQDATDPRTVDVSLSVFPAWEMDYINITFSLLLTA